MDYRRAFVPGATYFFTVVTAHRRPVFRRARTVACLRQAFRHVRRQRPMTVPAMVVLPDHLHCVWTLPRGDADYPTRWRLIKTWVTQRSGLEDFRRPKRTVWQARYWEHVIRDETDYRQHVDYIHYNPVKHGYVHKPGDWPYSSFRRCVKAGLYSEEWGRTEPVLDSGVGQDIDRTGGISDYAFG